jgi:AP2 domain
MSLPPLSHSDLMEAMAYDPSTGVLSWKRRADRSQSWNTRFAGKEAGSILSNGYRYINFGGRLCLAHMIIRFYVTGEWPTKHTDHRKCGFEGRSDNRWANLRPANPSGNAINSVLRSTNKSGIKGVSWDKVKRNWVATLTKDRKRLYLGNFARLEDAAQARLAASAAHHGEFAYAGAD